MTLLLFQNNTIRNWVELGLEHSPVGLFLCLLCLTQYLAVKGLYQGLFGGCTYFLMAEGPVGEMSLVVAFPCHLDCAATGSFSISPSSVSYFINVNSWKNACVVNMIGSFLQTFYINKISAWGKFRTIICPLGANSSESLKNAFFFFFTEMRLHIYLKEIQCSVGE